MNKKQLGVVIILAAAAVLLVLFWQPIRSYFKGQPYLPYSWYAVHLQNGHVYFGHISALNGETLSLADTFYLEPYTQAGQASESGNYKVESSPQQIYTLMRRGAKGFMDTDNVLHIDRHSVLFWEKLDKDSEVAKVIREAIADKK